MTAASAVRGSTRRRSLSHVESASCTARKRRRTVSSNVASLPNQRSDPALSNQNFRTSLVHPRLDIETVSRFAPRPAASRSLAYSWVLKNPAYRRTAGFAIGARRAARLGAALCSGRSGRDGRPRWRRSLRPAGQRGEPLEPAADVLIAGDRELGLLRVKKIGADGKVGERR